MTYLEFMKLKENEALENNKEDSAVVLLLEHICNLETNALFMKRGEEIEEEYVNKFNEIFEKYIHENKHIQYEIMKCEDTLIDHLKEVQELANKRYNQLMEEFKKRENITEELKQKDQMKWVGLMNNISNCVDEIVLKECIYND